MVLVTALVKALLASTHSTEQPLLVARHQQLYDMPDINCLLQVTEHLNSDADCGGAPRNAATVQC